MPIFAYHAKKSSGETVAGKIDAQNKEEAIDRINQMGLLATSIQQETAVSKIQKLPTIVFSKKAKRRDLIIFSRQLSSLIKSGVSLLESLSIISGQVKNPHLQDIIRDMYSQVKDGNAFSSTLERHKKIFSPLYIAIIKTSEGSGALPEALSRIADYEEKQEVVKSKVKSAMVYPALIAVVGIGTVAFMLTYVVPKLMYLFKDMGGSLPLVTRILIWASECASRYGLWAIAAAVVIFFILVREAKTAKGKVAFGSLQLKLPLLGSLVKKGELGRFSRSFEILIRSGMPVLKALKISTPILSNEIIRKEFESSYEQLEGGASFGETLKGSEVIPPFMSSLVMVGEKSGRLDEAMAELADTYEREVAEGVQVMTTLLEPMMILIMGFFVGFIVIAMLLPIFEMNFMVK